MTKEWRVGLSKYWYAGSEYRDLLKDSESLYVQGMIETEQLLLEKLIGHEFFAKKRNLAYLGPGDGEKVRILAESCDFARVYLIDVNQQSLEVSEEKLSGITETVSINQDFKEGLQMLTHVPKSIYLGATYSNRRAFGYNLDQMLYTNMHNQDVLYISTQMSSRENEGFVLEQYQSIAPLIESMCQPSLEKIGIAGFNFQLEFRRSYYGEAHVLGSYEVYESKDFAAQIGVCEGDKVIAFMAEKPYVDRRNYPFLDMSCRCDSREWLINDVLTVQKSISYNNEEVTSEFRGGIFMR